ncbi:hypothetical protein CJ199_15080, partial [Brevibacterium paucivorans]
MENNADEADVIFFLGSRPDPNTGEEWENYRGGAANGQAGPGVIHVYPDPNVIGRFFPAHVGTAASPTVVTFAGDGCFMMNGQELATMAANNLDVLVIVVNNSLYGTIHMHQE